MTKSLNKGKRPRDQIAIKLCSLKFQNKRNSNRCIDLSIRLAE